MSCWKISEWWLILLDCSFLLDTKGVFEIANQPHAISPYMTISDQLWPYVSIITCIYTICANTYDQRRNVHPCQRRSQAHLHKYPGPGCRAKALARYRKQRHANLAMFSSMLSDPSWRKRTAWPGGIWRSDSQQKPLRFASPKWDAQGPLRSFAKG